MDDILLCTADWEEVLKTSKQPNNPNEQKLNIKKSSDWKHNVPNVEGELSSLDVGSVCLLDRGDDIRS